jgi:hypothetical protein
MVVLFAKCSKGSSHWVCHTIAEHFSQARFQQGIWVNKHKDFNDFSLSSTFMSRSNLILDSQTGRAMNSNFPTVQLQQGIIKEEKVQKSLIMCPKV